jgi:ketosteroid isomerase-like protein
MRVIKLNSRFRQPLAVVVVLAGATLLTAASFRVTPFAGEKRNASAGQSGEERQVANTIEALFRAAEAGDLTSLDSLYAGPQLTVIESTGINRGWADFRDNHLAPEIKQIKNFRYRPFEIEPHVSGSLAWAIFRYYLKGDLDGRSLDLIGRGTAVLEKKGGRWVVRHTHTASRPRRPSDPPANF